MGGAWPALCDDERAGEIVPRAGLHRTLRARLLNRALPRRLLETGSIWAPMNAFLLLQGIETVALRIERHVENAEKVARFLRNDRVGWVNYAGFQDSPTR